MRARELGAWAHTRCTHIHHTQEFWLFQEASTVCPGHRGSVVWPPFPLILPLSVSFSQSHSPLSIPLFSPQQLERQSGRRGMCEHALWGLGKGSTREKVGDKKRGIDERETQEGRRRKERRRPVLIGLCGHAGLWWSGLAKPCASIVGLALHASRASGQPQLTLVCSLAVSNVRPGRVVPPTSTLHSTVQEASLMGMDAWVWVYGLFGSTSLGWGGIPVLLLLFTYLKDRIML